MGGLTSFATSAVQVLGAANTALKAVEDYNNNAGTRDYEQSKAKSDLELQIAQQDAANQKEQIRLTAEKTEAERVAALRRAVARQKAQFGASGVGSGSGSSQAVLLGLFDESEEEKAQRESLDALKTAAIDQNLDQQKRINTLQLSQLKERNKLSKATSAFDAFSSLL